MAEIIQTGFAFDTNCKGLFFRAYENCYYDGKTKFVQSFTIRLLKRISCKGCDMCEPFWDHYNEIDKINWKFYTFRSGGIYTPKVVTMDYNSFDGFADGWNYTFEDVTREKQKEIDSRKKIKKIIRRKR